MRRILIVSLAAGVLLPLAAQPAQAQDSLPPLLLGMAIHVEGWHQERQDESLFRLHEAELYDTAAAAQAAGAILTFEFSPIFTEAADTWGSTLPADVVAMGHGVGVHADVGGNGESLTAEEFAAELVPMRETVSRQTGVDVRHISGICSPSPWVEGAILAGFTSATGSVEYCALSLDPENVPPGYENLDCSDGPASCHGVFPDDIKHKIHP